SNGFLQAVQLCGAWDRNDARLLSQQPRERDLSRRRLLAFCDFSEQINQRLIRFTSLRRKTRKCAAQVRTVERSVFVHLAREKPSAERAKRNETDSKFLKRR